MYYNNYPYGIFNPAYLNQYRFQQTEIKRQCEQQKNIRDMVKAIADYCDAVRKVHPDFRQVAIDACLAEIACQATKDRT